MVMAPDRPHAYVRARVTWGARGLVDYCCKTCGGSELALPHLLHTPRRRVSLAAALAAIAAHEVTSMTVEQLLAALAETRAVQIAYTGGYWYVDAGPEQDGPWSESYYATTLWGALDGLYQRVQEKEAAWAKTG